MKTTRDIRARVDAITPLTDSIVQLILAPEEFIDYQAGQYLQILWQDQALSYSIANASLGSHRYELHIRHTQENTLTHQLLDAIKSQGTMTIRLPLGNCYLQALPEKKPLVFIAGGTGFAPIKAMIEQLLAEDYSRPFKLFWSARSVSDLYMDEKVKAWQAHVSRFDYISLITSGQQHALEAALKNHLPDFGLDSLYVLSGPFEMVHYTRDQLIQLGIPRSHLFSDAF